MRRRLVPVFLLLFLVSAVPPAAAQFQVFGALKMLEEGLGISRARAKRKKRRADQKARELAEQSLKDLESPSPLVRRRATAALARLLELHKAKKLLLEKPERFGDALAVMLTDPDWQTRWDACRGLVALGYRQEDLAGLMTAAAQEHPPGL